MSNEARVVSVVERTYRSLLNTTDSRSKRAIEKNESEARKHKAARKETRLELLR
jgi:hypothetical protein